MSHPEDIFAIQGLSINDVGEVMNAVGVSAAFQTLVTEGLQQVLVQRRETAQDEEFALGLDRFVLIYERALGDDANDSNIEGWIETLDEYSQTVLASFEGRQELNDAQQLAREIAAYTYIFLNFQISRGIDPALLERSGLHLDDILISLKETSVQTLLALREPQEKASELSNLLFQSLDGPIPRLNRNDEYWERFGLILLPGERIGQLRTALEQSGREIPRLDEDGRFGDEDELPI